MVWVAGKLPVPLVGHDLAAAGLTARVELEGHRAERVDFPFGGQSVDRQHVALAPVGGGEGLTDARREEALGPDVDPRTGDQGELVIARPVAGHRPDSRPRRHSRTAGPGRAHSPPWRPRPDPSPKISILFSLLLLSVAAFFPTAAQRRNPPGERRRAGPSSQLGVNRRLNVTEITKVRPKTIPRNSISRTFVGWRN